MVPVSELGIKQAVFLTFLVCLCPWAISAQETIKFPGVPINAKTLRVQEHAEGIYERTDYKRALFIYRNELAPIGDKYGQYMVGYMHLAGKGVPEDRVAASAWYRLAAERGTKELVQARDGLMNSLDAEEKARSDRLFIEIRKECGDLALLMEAIRADREMLRGRTGSRLSAGTSPLVIIEPNLAGSTTSGVEYYGRIERRMNARLAYIVSRIRIDIVDIDDEHMDLSLIESKVDEHLDKLN